MMETKQLNFDTLMEIGVSLNELPVIKKDFVMNKVIELNNAVRDYESRINNAINQLER